MAATAIDWRGEAGIMSLDLPINWLLKGWAIGQQSDNARLLATALGTLQYWWYADIIKRGGLAMNSNAWDALSALGTTFIATVLYGETLSRQQWLGTALIIAGLALV